VGSVSTASGDIDRDHLSDLGANVCGSYTVDTGTTIIKQMRDTIAIAMGKVDGNQNPTREEMFAFLNKHTNKLTCWGKHYLAVAFDKGVYMTVYKEFLKVDSDDDDAYPVNFNSITMTYNPSNDDPDNKEPMTILDYIQNVALKDRSIIMSPDAVKNVKYIRKMIRRPKYGALFYRELPEAERVEFEKQQAAQ
tara:strand:- start:66847 stop:67425 length:579 start_codon:yes stop_codon:yes gene_type:complete